MTQVLRLTLLITLVSVLSNCASTGGSSSGGSAPLPNQNHPAVKAMNARIAQEPRGNYYIGRRWWTEGTRFWGYIRQPGQPWSQSQLVLMDESVKRSPDRLPERPETGPAHGYDHNYEYRIYGSFTGRKAYDPNSNLELPVFRLVNYELINPTPGFLFYPGENYSRKRMPPKFPTVPR